MKDQRLHDEFMEAVRRMQAAGRRSLRNVLGFQDALDASLRGKDRWTDWLRMRRN